MRKGKFRTRFKRKGKTYYAIRKSDGKFDNIESISRAMRADKRKRSKKKVKPGQGFRGDIKK